MAGRFNCAALLIAADGADIYLLAVLGAGGVDGIAVAQLVVLGLKDFR